MNINSISGIIIDGAMKVHSTLEPGLLEKVYQTCLKHELLKKNIKVSSEVGMPVVYDGINIDIGYRLDLLVEDRIVVELKSVSSIIPVHKAQLFTYLKLSKKPLGLLLNFGEKHLKNGITRIIN